MKPGPALVVSATIASAVALLVRRLFGSSGGSSQAACDEKSLRQRVVDVAMSEVGKKNLDVYFADAAPQFLGEHPDWCGIFALWALHQAGLLRDKSWKTGYGFLETHPALPATSDPQPGDIAYFTKNQHQALVRRNNGNGTVDLINGNGWGGVVSLSTSKIEDIHTTYSIRKAVADAIAKGCA